MKRLICMVLTFAMLTAVFAACGQGTSAPSAAVTSNQESDAQQSTETNASESPSTLDMIGSGELKYDPNLPVNDGKDITIKFWYDDPGPEGYARYAKAIEDYQTMHPNVKFDVNSFLGWSDYWAKLPVSLTSGTGPDIMHFHLNWFGEFIPTLAAPYPDEMKDALLKDFSGIEPMMYDDKIYTIPLGNMTGAMFYNKTMWQQAGLTEADIPKTWDEAREVAKKLTQTDANGKITVNGMDIADGFFMLALNYQKNRMIFAEDGKNTQMNNPDTLAAAQMLQDMIMIDKVYAVGSGSPQERFGNQQSAMLYCWTWLGGWLKGNVGDSFEWGVFPTPTFADSKAVDRNNPEASAVVNANSSPEAQAVAMDFLKFYLASDEYLLELCNNTYTAPAKKVLLQNPALQDNIVISTISSYIDKTVWTGLWSSGFDSLVSQVLGDEILLQHKDAAESLKKFDDENAKVALEAQFATVERQSPLASQLK